MRKNVLFCIIDKNKVYFMHNTFPKLIEINQEELIIDNSKLNKNKYHFLKYLPSKRKVFTIIQLLIIKGKVNIFCDMNSNYFFVEGIKEVFFKMNVFRDIRLINRIPGIYTSIEDEMKYYMNFKSEILT